MLKHTKRESGEVMIEATIVLVITLLMLVWILGVGFLYYQKYTVRIATNDLARKIATSYDAPNSDLLTGYIRMEDLTTKSVYKSSNAEDLRLENEMRAQEYAAEIVKKANLYNTVEDVDVTLDFKMDAYGRSHIAVTTRCNFNTAFGLGLEVFGMSGKQEYVVTAYAESTSITDYVSAVATADAFTNGSIIKLPGFLDSTVKMIDAFIGMLDQFSK